MSRTALHHISGRLAPPDPATLCDDIRDAAGLLFPGRDPGPLDRAAEDVIRLHRGEYPGWRASATPYHDLEHTLTVTLACVRILHGIHLERKPLAPENLDAGLLAALFHDAGYIQAEDDTEGTGAKYTPIHVQRSVDFMRSYMKEHGLPENLVEDAASAVLCTDLSLRPADLPFSSDRARLVGCALGSADILAQMADEAYLDKLPRLYQEFREAGTPYRSEYELLRDTSAFHQAMRKRLAGELDNVAPLARAHFRERWDLDQDLYALAVDRNIKDLQEILGENGNGSGAGAGPASGNGA